MPLLNGLVAKLCGLWLGHLMPGSADRSVYVRSTRQMQTTDILGKNDSWLLPQGSITSWNGLWLSEHDNIPSGVLKKKRKAITYLPGTEGGRDLMCHRGYPAWLSKFPPWNSHLRLGKSQLEVRWNEVRWCSWPPFQFFYATSPWKPGENNSKASRSQLNRWPL